MCHGMPRPNATPPQARGSFEWRARVHLPYRALSLSLLYVPSHLALDSSGRSYAPWEEIAISTFSITDAVSAAAQEIAYEDLAERDSGVPTSAETAIAVLPPIHIHSASHSLSTRTAARNKLQSKVSGSMPALSLKREPTRCRHLRSAPQPIQANFALRKIRIAKSGFIGIKDEGGGLDPLEDFQPGGKHEGFTLYRSPIVDSDGKVCAVYGGMPDDDDFMSTVHDPAVAAMEDARNKASLNDEACTIVEVTSHSSLEAIHLVADKPSLARCSTGYQRRHFHSLISPCLPNLAGLFATWAPNAFDFYVDYMKVLRPVHPPLPPLSQQHLVCMHLQSWASNMCTTPQRLRQPSVRLVRYHGAWQLRPHTRRPPCPMGLQAHPRVPTGSTILIPSAAILHSNIPIGAGERRYSFTQYTAGGLFRWVEHGFRTVEAYFASLTQEKREEEKALGLARASAGAAYFSTLAELA
ncbi:hypothetical protein B0H12DRAFT_1080432 [Mycena haematopus]|nr:hypothetical protein B0H12DRAFT_1080432 [Mycena haematopus]